MEINMPIKDVKTVFMQSRYSSILLILEERLFECPDEFLGVMPKQEDLNIMNMNSER